MGIEEVYEQVVENKDKVFFHVKGLTSSEANHKADLLKAKAEAISAELNMTAAYTAVLNFDEGKKVALDNFKAVDLAELCGQEGDLYALSAWLREGVKAKRTVLSVIKNLPISEFLMDGEVFPEFTEERPNFNQPQALKIVTENDIIGEMSVKERAEYYAVEARAAHIGKKIHNKGIVAYIRKDLQDGKISTFRELPNGNGSKTYLIDYTPLYNQNTIDNLFFELQSEHRSLEQRLNWFKANIENEVSKRNAQQQKEHTDLFRLKHAEFVKNTEAFNLIYDTYRKECDAISSGLETRRLELTSYVSSLKIVVPDGFTKLIETL